MATLAATASFAQSSVTLYGNIDQSVYRTKTNGDYVLSSNSNGGSTSLWGITGTEDLGGGNKASFDLKSELTLASGATGASTTGLDQANSRSSEVFNRGAWVGVSNAGLGDFKIGRQNDAWWETTTKFNNTGITSFGWANATAVVSGTASNHLAALSGGTGVGTAMVQAGTQTANPSFRGTGMAFYAGISYATPSIAGFQFKVGSGVPKALYNISTETNNLRTYSLNYSNGPLTAAWATTDTNIGNNSGAKNTMIAAKYVLGQYTLTAAQNRSRLGSDVTAAMAHDADVTAFGVGYALSAKWNIDVGYTTIKDKIDSANKFTQTGVVGKYALSKRTTWYVGYGKGATDGAAKFTTIYGGGGSNLKAGEGETSLITGIKHTF